MRMQACGTPWPRRWGGWAASAGVKWLPQGPRVRMGGYRAVEVLAARLQDEDVSVREAVAEATVPVLVGLLTSSDLETRVAAISTISKCNLVDCLDRLRTHLDDADALVAYAAAKGC